MNTIIKVLLPYILCIGVGGYLVYDNMSTKAEVRELKWDLATMENRATSAEYNLEQEKKYAKEQRAFREELDLKFSELNSSLDNYTKRLQGIKDERNKTNTTRALSEPVARVLKDFTNSTNKD